MNSIIPANLASVLESGCACDNNCLLCPLIDWWFFVEICLPTAKAKKLAITTNCSYNQDIEFEWDESKQISNLHKHGINFSDVPAVFGGSIVTVEDERFDYGEERFVTFGLLQGRVVAVVHTESEDSIRIISARKATKYEQEIYFEQI